MSFLRGVNPATSGVSMSLADQQWCPTSVQVTVHQARGLRGKGKSGTNDAYAVMQVGKEKYQTSVDEKSVAPVWKEEAAFDLPPLHQGGGGGGGTERSTLHVHVLHRALVGPDKLLGQAVINLLQLSEDKTRNKTEWFKLLDKTGKADKDRGEVLVDIQFMRNNMTASMFDLSAAGKSRSRLGKFKDKVRGKKKESDAASTVVPSFSQVLTDSEEEGDGDGEVAAGKDKKKKKHKMKSLFSPKSNLQKNMSQSMSVLPARNSSLSGSQSSGLNVDSSGGKKKFKFMIHKRSGSSDSKDSSSGHQKHGAAEQSNLCINGSHVYCEEPQPRTSRIGSNFSLTSSGHGSMEDVPESSPPSVDSLRAVRQYSPWTEEEEETAEVGNIKEDVGELRREEEERIRVEEERRRKEEEEERVRRQEEEEEELERLAEEKRRQEEEERRRTEEERIKREEEERIRREEEERAQEERRQEEEERVRREEEQLERLAEEKRRREEERRRIEEEERQREEEERIRMKEEMAQEERRRQEEELKLEEEKRRLEEERRTEEEKVRKEEERVQEERRRREEEDMVRRQKEELEEKRRLEEQERRQREEEERIKKEEEEEKARREKEDYERLVEEKRKLEEEERKRIEAEEKTRREEEESRRVEEEERMKEEEEERVRRQEEEREKSAEEKRILEEQERRRIEEEEQRQSEEEERIRKEEEERAQEERRRQEEEERVRRQEELERLAEEKRRQEEEERRRIEEERLKREEEEKCLKEKEARAQEERRREEEERVRKEKEDIERLAEKRRLEEQEKRSIEEEERIRREEKAEKERKEEARKLEEEKLVADAEEQRENKTKYKAAGKKSEESPAQVTSTNPFDENFSNNPFEESSNSPPGPDSSSASTVQQRCQSAVSSVGSKTVFPDEKDLISSQREKRPAPQPPGRIQAERQSRIEQDGSTPHLAQINKQSKDKEVKTVSVLPQRSVQMIAPLSRSPTDAKNTQSLTQTSATKGTSNAAKPSKRPAPSRPRSVEEGPSSEPKTAPSSDGNISHKCGSKAKQEPIVYGLNPFEDDEDENELTAQDDTTAFDKTGSIQWLPAVSRAADKEAAPQTKIKSSKVARAPPLPAKKAATSSTLIIQNTEGDHVTDDTGVTEPDNSVTHAGDPEPEAISRVHVQETPAQESQPATVQTAGEEAGGKKEGPPTTSRRLQPVKPLNPVEQQSGEKDDKSTGILCEVQKKTKVNDTGLKGPYSQLTQEELISLVLKQKNQLSERDRKISELEQYIDKLLVRVIEEQPSILMSMNSV
ncbi:rab11 family-interacting protein 1-like [Enoplosus armatus]|uniref:rab11 family-interacting protein 1-like n=1 Tax=Enoplosus armatus TaxID=215367 RepID=UPI0039969EBE